MRKKSEKDIFGSTNALRVLSFLVENPGKDFLGSEIQKDTSLSRAGVYFALCDLVKQKLVSKAQKGKFSLYAVAYSDPIVQQFKVLRNIVSLNPVIYKLRLSSKKIVLYGSASRGEDFADSDMDLFVVSKDPAASKKAISSVKTKRKIQAVIKTPSELSMFEEKNRTFHEEVRRGITLWEEKE